MSNASTVVYLTPQVGNVRPMTSPPPLPCTRHLRHQTKEHANRSFAFLLEPDLLDALPYHFRSRYHGCRRRHHARRYRLAAVLAEMCCY